MEQEQDNEVPQETLPLRSRIKARLGRFAAANIHKHRLRWLRGILLAGFIVLSIMTGRAIVGKYDFTLLGSSSEPVPIEWSLLFIGSLALAGGLLANVTKEGAALHQLAYMLPLLQGLAGFLTFVLCLSFAEHFLMFKPIWGILYLFGLYSIGVPAMWLTGLSISAGYLLYRTVSSRVWERKLCAAALAAVYVLLILMILSKITQGGLGGFE